MGMAVKEEAKSSQEFHNIINPSKPFKMKTITFDTPREFALFKTLANQLHILFMYSVHHGIITVEADAYELEGLGY
jgi:IS30 family transposase